MHCYVRGVNHDTAPIEARERLAFKRAEVVALLDAFSRAGAPEACVLSTCNRTEFYAAGKPAAELSATVDRVLDEFIGAIPARNPEYWYEREDRQAVNHLFRVAAGLDSMVLGETEVLGQVKDAFAIARGAGSAGVFLNDVFDRSLHVAKKVRTETALGVGSISLASVTHDVFRRDLGDLADQQIVLFGTGEIAGQVARYFGSDAVGRFTILSRTRERAERLASEAGGEAGDIAQKQRLLRDCDGVICASAASYYLVRRNELETAGRKSLVDLSHPRNIDPAIQHLPNMKLYAMDDLRSEIDKNLTRRKREIPFAEAIIERESGRLAQWHMSLPLAEAVKTFRAKFERVRQAELARMNPRLNETERRAVDEATRRILQKFLHTPTLTLKSLNADDPVDMDKIALLNALFDLTGDADE